MAYRTARLLALTLILSAGCLAADCPVEVLKAFRQSDANGQSINVSFRNTAHKEIVGIKFGFVFFNAVDEPFTETRDFSAIVDGWLWRPDVADKDQPTINIKWKLQADGMIYIDAYPIKVKFADGGIWTDDGSGQCNLGVRQLNIGAQAGLRAELAQIERQKTAPHQSGTTSQ